jgi:hypothetical protein
VYVVQRLAIPFVHAQRLRVFAESEDNLAAARREAEQVVLSAKK